MPQLLDNPQLDTTTDTALAEDMKKVIVIEDQAVMRDLFC